MQNKNPSGAIVHENTLLHQQILDKYWQLANLEPEQTKGNIAGQLKALDALCQEMQLGPHSKSSNKERPQTPEIYRSEWLRIDGDSCP